jgi:deferrochelatase/peroxidase EfeB
VTSDAVTPEVMDEPPEHTPAEGISRRRLLGAAGAGALAGAAALGAVEVARAQVDHQDVPSAGLGYPFHGEHQAGIVTPTQDRLHFASFDVTTDSRDELIALLRAWTEAAAAMTAGKPVGSGAVTSYDSPPADTGEALGLPPAGLTLTFGFGPTLFEKSVRAIR